MSAARVPEPSFEVDLGDQWEAIEARVQGKRQRRRVGRGVLATAVLAMLGWSLWSARSAADSTPSPALAEVKAEAIAPVIDHEAEQRPSREEPGVSVLRLADGSLVAPTEGSVVAECPGQVEEPCYALDSGSAQFDILPQHARQFTVRAGRVELVLREGSFTLRRESDDTGELVVVAVISGRVQVAGSKGEAKILGAGETWSLHLTPERTVAASEPSDAAEASAATGTSDVDASAKTAPAAAKPAASARPAPTGERVKDIWREAGEARKSGNLRVAADKYREIWADHSKDSTGPRCGFRARASAHGPAR